MYCITVYSGTIVLQYALLRCYLWTLSVLFCSAVRDYSDAVHYACSLTAMHRLLLLLQAIT